MLLYCSILHLKLRRNFKSTVQHSLLFDKAEDCKFFVTQQWYMYDFDVGSARNEPVTEKTYNISNKLSLMSGCLKTFWLLAFNDFT